MEQIKKFTEEFFRNLKCEVRWESRREDGGRRTADEVLLVENVPKVFEDLFGKVAPYRICFSREIKGCEFVGKGSVMMDSILKFLKGSGKTTILKIDFDIDSEKEIEKRFGFKNCEIESLTRGYRNNFFSRFSFLTTFNYLNESEKMTHDIYVHNGDIVDGDLDGYTVLDGRSSGVEGGDVKVDSDKVKRDYEVAKKRVGELVLGKKEKLGEDLREKVEAEIDRIREHYDNALVERGSDLNGILKKIREVELLLRSCEDIEREELRRKLVRLRGQLVREGDDEVISRVLKEREMTVKDAMHKFSLNMDRKLVNTTVIYYPIYNFKIFLEGDNGSRKFVEVSYDPLTKGFDGLNCEVCSRAISRINLCSGGHVSCDDCLSRCGSCGKGFCEKCLKKSCVTCGRRVCRECVRVCLKCGGSSCKDHFRKDVVSGEERCMRCLRACLRCQGLAEEKFFGEARDGSKVCQKCLGEERRGAVLDKVFRR